MNRCYYEAYDDRYRQVHGENLMWFAQLPSQIVLNTIAELGINHTDRILELGCGEGRDAVHLLRQGWRLTATDISPEAIRYCRERNPQYAEYFRRLNCLAGQREGQYDFIYAVALIHMLVEDEDRASFFRFFREHLRPGGFGLICTMGDGSLERKSDVSTAFDLQERIHGETGTKLQLAGTSCRMVAWDTFLREIRESGLTVAEHGLTSVEPDFPVMMYAVVT